MDFLYAAALTGLVVGLTCAWVGHFVILRQLTFLSLGLTQVAAVGVVLGLMTGFPPLLAAFALAVAGALGIPRLAGTHRGARGEGPVAAVYVAAAALAMVLIHLHPMLESRDLNLLEGNLLYVSWTDLAWLSAGAVAIWLPHLLLRRPLLFVAKDPEAAAGLGALARLWERILLVSVGLTVALGVQACGLLFVFAFLILPGLVGLTLARSVRGVFAVSLGIAALAVVGGMALSYRWDLPASPVMIVLLALAWAAGLGLARVR